MSSPTLTRRALIASLGTATATAALAVPAIAAVQAIEAAPILSPRERMDQAIAEFKAAYEAVHDNVEGWIMAGDVPVPRLRATPVLWSGDGRYEVEDGKFRPIYTITRAPQYDGVTERWFRVSTGFKSKLERTDFFCREACLPTIVRRVAA